MSEPVYFSKVEFRDRIGYGKTHSVILLDLVQKELSYQVFEWEKQMPAISGSESYEIDGDQYKIDINTPAKTIKSGKNKFKQSLLVDEQYNQKVAFSYGIKLSDEKMQQLLPYCNAIDFEPYRNKEMSMSDEGYIGYRDEVSLRFTAISESCIPKMEWDMRYYYDEEHIWPSERLYRYIVLEYFQDNKKLKGWNVDYTSLKATITNDENTK